MESNSHQHKGDKILDGEHSTYEHPLVSRYASKEMSFIWSPQKKFSTWRKLWVALAESEKELGLNITEEQLQEMRHHIDDIDYDLAEKKENEFRHDVMAHVHTFGVKCPKAMPIIHLGATSCFVGDNTDLIQMKESLLLLRNKTINLLSVMKEFAMKHRATPTLGFTHFQPAQLTTIGKRACLWIQDLVIDFNEIQRLIDELPLRGVKGTTGTQATFLGKFPASPNERFVHSRFSFFAPRCFSLLLSFFISCLSLFLVF
jgi:adenylosuccinate lyase